MTKTEIKTGTISLLKDYMDDLEDAKLMARGSTGYYDRKILIVKGCIEEIEEKL